MSPPENDGDLDEARSSLIAVISDPADGRQRLPYLVGLLDHDERPVRIGAAWALCLVAERHPDTAAYLVRRLVDRLEDPDSPIEVAHAFEYLADRYPDAVEEELAEIESESDGFPGPTMESSGPSRPFHRTGPGSRPIGRTRVAAGRANTGPRRVHTEDQGETPREGGESREESVDESDRTDDGSPIDGGRVAVQRLPAVESQHRFDDLSVLATSRRNRYGDVYRSVGRIDDEELAVGVVLFHHPGNEDEQSFVEQLDDRLGDWQSVDDHRNVVTLYDWAVRPRPWAAVEYTDQTLADFDPFEPDEARWQARRIADAVRHLHENGVVHAGIDPRNVAYYGNVLEADERQPPLLTNVGLLSVFRFHFDPATCLDPRYAAPEYFDRRFGRIDHATDIYQLGAVCYRLFTGRAPFTGSFSDVREAVVDADPPAPSAAMDHVPSAVDDIVTKAMAKSKLNRYESVTHFAQELATLDDEANGSDQ